VATLLIGGLSSSVASATSPESGVTSLTAAIARIDSLLAAGAATEALRLAEAGAGHVSDPVNGWQWQQRWGLALLLADRPAEAVPHLEAAVRAAPYRPENHRNLATALVTLGRGGRAVGEFQEAVALAPDDPELRLEYGQALRSLGMGEEARRELESAAYLCDGCPAATRALAELHVAEGRLDVARPYLRRAHAQAPDAWTRKALALAELRAGEPDSAAELLEAAPFAERDDETWLLLAEADRARRRAERWPALLAESPSGASLPASVRASAPFWSVVGQALHESGRTAEALAAVDLAVARAPRDTVYWNQRIALLQELGRDKEARTLYRRLQERRAGNGGGP
jgi:Flp pilus assembly protein TadD